MANIRFAKPPNDNRIRSLQVDGSSLVTVPKENFFITASSPKINNVNRITTSQQKNYTDTLDMFVTSKNNNCQSDMSESLANKETTYNGNNKYDNNTDPVNTHADATRSQFFKKVHFAANHNTPHIVSDSNTNDELFADTDRNSKMSLLAERNNNNVGGRTESFSSNNNNNSINTVTDIKELQNEFTTDISQTLKGSQAETTGDKSSPTSSDSDQNDFLEEDEDQFPETRSLFSKMEVNFDHENQQMLIQQSDQQRSQNKILQDKQVMTSSSSSLSASSSDNRQRHQTSSLFQNGTRSKNTRSYRPIHRSISDAALIENNRISSFFKSIADDRYYGLDEEDDDDDVNINLSESGDFARKNELLRLTQPSKIAWETGINHQRAVNFFDKTTEKTSQQGPGQPLVSKPSEGHVPFARSLSGDSVITDRLRIRRFALADPENMIMRQEVREKIEREVERRRSSMVRKISQFFNVHLGLNKEEDLI